MEDRKYQPLQLPDTFLLSIFLFVSRISFYVSSKGMYQAYDTPQWRTLARGVVQRSAATTKVFDPYEGQVFQLRDHRGRLHAFENHDDYQYYKRKLGQETNPATSVFHKRTRGNFRDVIENGDLPFINVAPVGAPPVAAPAPPPGPIFVPPSVGAQATAAAATAAANAAASAATGAAAAAAAIQPPASLRTRALPHVGPNPDAAAIDDDNDDGEDGWTDTTMTDDSDWATDGTDSTDPARRYPWQRNDYSDFFRRKYRPAPKQEVPMGATGWSYQSLLKPFFGKPVAEEKLLSAEQRSADSAAQEADHAAVAKDGEAAISALAVQKGDVPSNNFISPRVAYDAAASALKAATASVSAYLFSSAADSVNKAAEATKLKQEERREGFSDRLQSEINTLESAPTVAPQLAVGQAYPDISAELFTPTIEATAAANTGQVNKFAAAAADDAARIESSQRPGVIAIPPGGTHPAIVTRRLYFEHLLNAAKQQGDTASAETYAKNREYFEDVVRKGNLEVAQQSDGHYYLHDKTIPGVKWASEARPWWEERQNPLLGVK